MRREEQRRKQEGRKGSHRVSQKESVATTRFSQPPAPNPPPLATEILEAIRRGAVSVDGVKRRVGAGMGRCQGSRCARAVMELLAEELDIPVNAVRKDGPGSEILEGGDGKNGAADKSDLHQGKDKQRY